MSIIKSQRLVLRFPNLGDTKFYTLGLADYEVAKNLLVPHPYNLAMAKEWLSQDFTKKVINEAHFVIELKDKSTIGGIGFNDNDGVAVLSYWLTKEYWGKGYASEATRAIIDWYFNNSKDEHILSGAFHFNKASLKIQQNLGFVEIGRSVKFCPARNIKVENIETKLNKEKYLGIKTK